MHQLVSPNTIPTQADSPQYGLLQVCAPVVVDIGDFTGRAPPILVQSYNIFFKEHTLSKEKWQESLDLRFGELHW